MYCNSCGKPNPDDSVYCSSCGKLLTTIPTQKPTSTQPVCSNTTPASKTTGTTLTDFTSHFRISWRKFATKPLALALIICHSVSMLLNFINLDTITESLRAIFTQLEKSGYFGFSWSDYGNSMVTLLQILLMAPGILTAIGLWMLYMDARDLSDRPLNVTGLKLIFGVDVTIMILYCLWCIALFCTACSAAQELSGSSYVIFAAQTAIKTAMTVLVVVCGAVTAILWVLTKLIISVRECAEKCEPKTKFVKGCAVIEFVSGGLSVFALLFSGITLNMVVSCVLPFMFGVILLKYKDLMASLLQEQANSEIE